MVIKGEGIGKFMNALQRAKQIDGKIIGEDGDLIKIELASNDKQAWVNYLVEQYLKKEPLDIPPPEFQIIVKDIAIEISRREINKIFGE